MRREWRGHTTAATARPEACARTRLDRLSLASERRRMSVEGSGRTSHTGSTMVAARRARASEFGGRGRRRGQPRARSWWRGVATAAALLLVAPVAAVVLPSTAGAATAVDLFVDPTGTTTTCT